MGLLNIFHVNRLFYILHALQLCSVQAPNNDYIDWKHIRYTINTYHLWNSMNNYSMKKIKTMLLIYVLQMNKYGLELKVSFVWVYPSALDIVSVLGSNISPFIFLLCIIQLIRLCMFLIRFKCINSFHSVCSSDS